MRIQTNFKSKHFRSIGANVFYYLQDEKEMEILATDKGAQDFIVLSYEPLYD